MVTIDHHKNECTCFHKNSPTLPKICLINTLTVRIVFTGAPKKRTPSAPQRKYHIFMFLKIHALFLAYLILRNRTTRLCKRNFPSSFCYEVIHCDIARGAVFWGHPVCYLICCFSWLPNEWKK